ncbi:hypothetical protein FAVG1_06571 [Fusarium avenaceum]|nr:hypothetical protein FAVG1_06571 [Fusarium avenaceum]
MFVAEKGCSQWKDLNDFSEYVESLHSKTRFNKAILELCHREICNAIYGTGNPDISGIGVAVGYVLEIALGVFLSLAVLLLKRKGKASQLYQVARTGLGAFFDSAAYFALALQLGTIAVLVRKDYGISTVDLGAIETRISQSVAVVSMMPLFYPLALLEPAVRASARSSMKHNARLLLLSMTIALSFYPFLSNCIHAFGVSPIGNGKDSEVSFAQWSAVEDMCFPQKYRNLGTTTTYKSLDGLELTASLIVYLSSVWLLAALPNTYYDCDKKATHGHEQGNKPSWRRLVNRWVGDRPSLAIVSLFAIVGLSVPLLWMIFTLRKLQEEMSEKMGQDYNGKDWGFGQIVSVVLFVPVGVEMAYQWRFRPAHEEGE